MPLKSTRTPEIRKHWSASAAIFFAFDAFWVGKLFLKEQCRPLNLERANSPHSYRPLHRNSIVRTALLKQNFLYLQNTKPRYKIWPLFPSQMSTFYYIAYSTSAKQISSVYVQINFFSFALFFLSSTKQLKFKISPRNIIFPFLNLSLSFFFSSKI